VEAQLCTVNIWPSNGLRDIFLWETNKRVTKKVAAFMYGNSLRLSDAVACYNACYGIHHSLMKMALKNWYDVWDRDKNGRYFEQFYRMRMKCQAWINRKAHELYEAVKPVVSVSEYGPSRIGHLARMIESIRSVEKSLLQQTS